MKLYKLLPCFLALAFLIVSCSSSSDDDEDIQLSQEQLDAITGTWILSSYEVSPAQDVNNDGTASENLVLELPCLTGTIILREDFTWSITSVSPNVTEITGGNFGISCDPASAAAGDWLFLNNEVVLSVTGNADVYELSGDQLTLNGGMDLPGFRRIVYQKQ